MYRNYEDPRQLEAQLEAWLKNHPKQFWDDYDYETYHEMKDRINYAWQDDEYNQDFSL